MAGIVSERYVLLWEVPRTSRKPLTNGGRVKNGADDFCRGDLICAGVNNQHRECQRRCLREAFPAIRYACDEVARHICYDADMSGLEVKGASRITPARRALGSRSVRSVLGSTSTADSG